MDNLGLLYNKELFNHLQLDLKGNRDNEKNNKNKHFYFPDKEIEKKDKNGRKYKETTKFGKFWNKITKEIKLTNGKQWTLTHNEKESFELETIYPGLLCGSGYGHEIGQNPDEFQLGLYFDYTTGLPVIPGSSVKGILKAGCESRKGYITEILTERLEKKVNLPNNFDENEFIKTVFEGEGLSIYERDVFFEAIPIQTANTLFGNDYITHHKSPLQNPNPIQFLRINGEVTYQFQFDLKNSNGITAEQKKQLLQQIILDLGLGAKTNVGYGQFQKSTQE